MVYLKLSQKYESESGDSRSDSFIVCHPSVSGLAHHKFSHNPPKTFDINLSSNVNFSVPLYHTFPILVPEFFVFIIFFLFYFFEEKKWVEFCDKAQKKNHQFKTSKISVQPPKGWVVPNWLILSPLTGRGLSSRGFVAKELCLRLCNIQDAG